MHGRSRSLKPLVSSPFRLRPLSSPGGTIDARFARMQRDRSAVQIPLRSGLGLRAQRRGETQVNREIRQTLESKPQIFSILNGGVVIVAHRHDVYEQKKILRLTNPSIINGWRTLGALIDFIKRSGQDGEDIPNNPIKYESSRDLLPWIRKEPTRICGKREET